MIKWIILFLFVVVLIPRDSQIVCPHKLINLPTQQHTAQLNDDIQKKLLAFISLLQINVGDLAEANLHNNYDKKSYLRLFSHDRYSKTRMQLYERTVLILGMFFKTGQSGTDYYIYTLQKMII